VLIDILHFEDAECGHNGRQVVNYGMSLHVDYFGKHFLLVTNAKSTYMHMHVS
jgi:hypothetical protein